MRWKKKTWKRTLQEN